MKSYPSCFLGKDVVSYLVDHKYAASKKDAVDLGHVLASHLSLFECVSKKGTKLLVDDAKSFYGSRMHNWVHHRIVDYQATKNFEKQDILPLLLLLSTRMARL